MAATPDRTTLADRTTRADLAASGAGPNASLAPSTPSPDADPRARAPRTPLHAAHR
ncbi:hypothetical protein [Streptomyces buecherae]|uniref:Uncharacterized protein n=1 Tax=Streptomyces buecherae TaxID=2763006 RepID=A0A7H8NAX1_9ACTN|nr:hypothetical protein [Streptomyces buecherae]QKW51615.1 hypothetical protein HUT08_21190 [Streptomyces buecherae]